MESGAPVVDSGVLPEETVSAALSELGGWWDSGKLFAQWKLAEECLTSAGWYS